MEVKKTMLMFLGMVLVPIVACSTLWAGELLVIANSGVSDEAVTRTTVSDIYLGKKTKWGNGEAIRVVMLKGGSTHERFVQEVVGTSPVKLKNYWKKVVFTGTGTPPKIIKTETDMVARVASTSGAIGYVDSATSHGGVKVAGVR